jgi:hypothetical protein
VRQPAWNKANGQPDSEGANEPQQFKVHQQLTRQLQACGFMGHLDAAALQFLRATMQPLKWDAFL